MHPSLRVRLYASADAAMVRQLCCDTADRGEPVDHFFRDREVFADCLLRYYTDYESQATWIAEVDGRVVGYLTGCLDTRRYRRLMRWPIVPQAVLQAIRRGALVRPQTWALLRTGAVTWWRGGFQRQVPLDRYPAHLHVNVRREFRDHHVGQALVERFCEQVTTARLPGLHAVVREDNPRACAFFERLGFMRLNRQPTTFISGHLHYTVMYGKQI